jgi:hypothetical protein
MKDLNTRLTYEALYVIITAYKNIGAEAISIIYQFTHNIVEDTKLLFRPHAIASFDKYNTDYKYKYVNLTENDDDSEDDWVGIPNKVDTVQFKLAHIGYKHKLCRKNHTFGTAIYHIERDYYTYRCDIPGCGNLKRSLRGKYWTRYKLQYSRMMRANVKQCKKELQLL